MLAGVTAAASGRAFAQTHPPKVTTTPLNDHLHLISGAGANALLVSSGEGLVLVNGGSSEQSNEVLKAVAAQSGGKRLTTLFNSVTDDSWDEKTINGTNAPTIGPQLASSGPVVTGSYVTITLPNSVVTGNNDLNLALTPNSATALALSSREDPTNPPHLLVTTS